MGRDGEGAIAPGQYVILRVVDRHSAVLEDEHSCIRASALLTGDLLLLQFAPLSILAQSLERRAGLAPVLRYALLLLDSTRTLVALLQLARALDPFVIGQGCVGFDH